MEYTGFGKEKEEFMPRKSKEDFFRDGKVIKELYELTDDLVRKDQRRGIAGCLAMDVFNYAYCICWMFVQRKYVLSKIEAYMESKNEVERKYSWTVAYAPVVLHRNCHPLNPDTCSMFRSLVSLHLYRLYFSDFVKNNSLALPINFRAPFPVPEPVEFAKVKNGMIAAMDEAIRLKEECEELRNRLEVEKTKRKEAERISRDRQERLDVWEKDSFYKSVNINSILKYAQDRGNCDNSDIKTIRMMLLALCANKVPNDVIEAIKTLKLGGNVTIGEQHNHGCQQFYGNIADSEFPSK